MTDFEHDALVIRTCLKDGTSHGSFKYPLVVGGMVSAPDWKPTADCGNGLHGLLDGIGDWGLVPLGEDRVWQVLGVKRSECIDLGGDKVKFPRARELYAGLMGGAMKMVQTAAVEAIKAKAVGNTATGDRGHAAATGEHSCAISVGIEASAQGAIGTWLTLAYWEQNSEYKWELKVVSTQQIDGKKLKPGTAYRLGKSGKFVAV